jgi:hypothetical protein
MSEDNAPDVAGIAARLSEAQRVLAKGDYDPEFARIEDAFALERMGIWSFDSGSQDPDSEYYELDWTPRGLALRNHLMEKNDVQG